MLKCSEEAPSLAPISKSRSPGPPRDDDPMADLFDDNDAEQPIKKISVETSQLLGGDEQYTHLVRGLDKTLLHRVREEMKAKESTDMDLEEAEAYINRIDGAAEPEFITPMAKAIHSIVVSAAKPLPTLNPLFVEGRMAFVFDLGFDGNQYVGSPDLPSNLIRSRMEVAGEDGRTAGDLVVAKVADALAASKMKGDHEEGEVAYFVGEDGKRRIRKKDKEERVKKHAEKARTAVPSAASKPKEVAKDVIVGMDDDEE